MRSFTKTCAAVSVILASCQSCLMTWAAADGCPRSTTRPPFALRSGLSRERLQALAPVASAPESSEREENINHSQHLATAHGETNDHKRRLKIKKIQLLRIVGLSSRGGARELEFCRGRE